MILIASGAYVISEFQVELGKIPPCLLPIGNKKLLELQVSALRKTFNNQDIYLSLPESYELSSSENKIIDALNLTVVKTPDQFNLCDSLLYVLNTNEKMNADEVFYLLHGDTFISDFDNLKDRNIISVSRSYDSYTWEVVKQNNEHALVWSGFFSFSSISYLLKSLTLNRNDYVNAVKYYSTQHELSLIETDKWHDLGHSNTYFSSRANITTQRAFNDLKIIDGIVSKQGKPDVKIQAEALWFENIPSALKKFTPVLLNHGERNEGYYYELEYLPYIPLNELFVHGKNELLQWNKIIRKLAEYINISIQNDMDENSKRDINQDTFKLITDKTRDRLKEYSKEMNFDLQKSFIYKNNKLPSVHQIMEECIEKVLRIEIVHGVMHGDLCFSNILYDSRGDRIKVIDPRGLNYKAEFTVFGDLKYDFAKLTHSIVGLYDYIISGYYKIEESANGSIEIVFDIDERTEKVIFQYMQNFKVSGLSVQDIIPLVILLFMSMLPLHADRPDRQKAMLINALRLYKVYMLN